MEEQSALLLYVFLTKDEGTFDELIESLANIAPICSRSFKITKTILVGVVFDALGFHLPHFG